MCITLTLIGLIGLNQHRALWERVSTLECVMRKKIKIGALISGGGSNLQAIIDACDNGDIHGKVVFVGSDNPVAKGLDRATQHGIPSFTIDYGAISRQVKADASNFRYPQNLDMDHVFSTMMATGRYQDPESLKAFLRARIHAEDRLLEHLTSYSFDLLVLAGFMRTLTPYFIDRINDPPGSQRIMNIHPALLPAFPGVDGYGDTFRYGCRVGGCTVHFVDYGEDTGPIIGQAFFEIAETDDLDAIRKKGLAEEWRLYPKCIQYAAEGRLKTEQVNHQLKNGKSIQRTVVRILPRT
jgi:phosphoribosylglycinamide formyltransferase-1